MLDSSAHSGSSKKDDEGALEALYNISDGSPRYGHGAYDPIERIWRWLPAEYGPYDTLAQWNDAWQQRQQMNELTFYIVRRCEISVILLNKCITSYIHVHNSGMSLLVTLSVW